MTGKIVAEVAKLFLPDFQLPINDLVCSNLLFAIDAELDLKVEGWTLFLVDKGSKELACAIHLIQKFFRVLRALRRGAEILTAVQSFARGFFFALQVPEELNHRPWVELRTVNVRKRECAGQILVERGFNLAIVLERLSRVGDCLGTREHLATLVELHPQRISDLQEIIRRRLFGDTNRSITTVDADSIHVCANKVLEGGYRVSRCLVVVGVEVGENLVPIYLAARLQIDSLRRKECHHGNEEIAREKGNVLSLDVQITRQLFLTA